MLFFKKLNIKDDFEAVKKLIINCSDYFMLLDGYLPDDAAIEALFVHVPPQTPVENLDIMGVFEQGELVAALWATKYYPDKETAYIALYLVSEKHRKKGIGKIGYTHFEAKIREEAFQYLMLAVLKDNQNALRFWYQNDFKLFKSHPLRQFGNKWHEIEEFKKPII